MRSWRSAIEKCSSTAGPPLGKVQLCGKKFGGLFSVERKWESSTWLNEVGRVVLGGSKLGGFNGWNEVGRVLIDGTKLRGFY